MADVDIEASPDGLAHDFLLILRLGPIEDHAPPAATPPRQGHGNDFVHLLGREFAVSSTISRTRLAPRRFRMLFSRAPREGSRLSLVGPLGFFQLTFQVVNFSSQPLSFTLQPLSFPLRLFALRFPLLLSPPQYFVFFAEPFILLARTTPSLLKLLDLAFPLVKGCGKHRILFPQLTLTNCAGFGQHEFQCRNRMVRLSGRHTAEVPVFAVLNTVNNDGQYSAMHGDVLGPVDEIGKVADPIPRQIPCGQIPCGRERCLSGLGRVAQLVFFFFACSNSDSKATSGGHAWRLLDKPHLRPQPCIQIVLPICLLQSSKRRLTSAMSRRNPLHLPLRP